ncbi:CCR4-NOT transcription complex subunit 4 [Sparganum proliferum]
MRQARDRQRESIALSGSNPGKSVANIFRHRSSSKRGHELPPLLNDNKVFLTDDTDKAELFSDFFAKHLATESDPVPFVRSNLPRIDTLTPRDRSYATRNSSMVIPPPLCTTSKRSLFFASKYAFLWNNLPPEIRLSPNLLVFKSKLRKHLTPESIKSLLTVSFPNTQILDFEKGPPAPYTNCIQPVYHCSAEELISGVGTRSFIIFVLSPWIMSSDESDCPLCLEPMDSDDASFYPCPCLYQVCRFCWAKILNEENGLCPACRQPYDSEAPAVFVPQNNVTEHKRKPSKRKKETQTKAHISKDTLKMVIQTNLVFVVGLPQWISKDKEILKNVEYFGQFGKVFKVEVNPNPNFTNPQGQPSISAYITYYRPDDAMRAVLTLDQSILHGRQLRVSLGTTKYCSQFLKGQKCSKHECMYLHDLGDPKASFTKEQMQAGKHTEYMNELLQSFVAQMAGQQSEGGQAEDQRHSLPPDQISPSTAAASATATDKSSATSSHSQPSSSSREYGLHSEAPRNCLRRRGAGCSGSASNRNSRHEVGARTGFAGSGGTRHPAGPFPLEGEPPFPKSAVAATSLSTLKAFHPNKIDCCPRPGSDGPLSLYPPPESKEAGQNATSTPTQPVPPSQHPFMHANDLSSSPADFSGGNYSNYDHHSEEPSADVAFGAPAHSPSSSSAAATVDASQCLRPRRVMDNSDSVQPPGSTGLNDQPPVGAIAADIDFDPIRESQQGLAELLAAEMNYPDLRSGYKKLLPSGGNSSGAGQLGHLFAGFNAGNSGRKTGDPGTQISLSTQTPLIFSPPPGFEESSNRAPPEDAVLLPFVAQQIAAQLDCPSTASSLLPTLLSTSEFGAIYTQLLESVCCNRTAVTTASDTASARDGPPFADPAVINATASASPSPSPSFNPLAASTDPMVAACLLAYQNMLAVAQSNQNARLVPSWDGSKTASDPSVAGAADHLLTELSQRLLECARLSFRDGGAEDPASFDQQQQQQQFSFSNFSGNLHIPGLTNGCYNMDLGLDGQSFCLPSFNPDAFSKGRSVGSTTTANLNNVWSSQDVTTSAPLAQPPPPPPPPSHQQQLQAPNSASRQHDHHQGDEQCTDSQGQPATSCSSTQPPSAGTGTTSSSSSSSSSAAFRNFPCEPFNQPISEYSALSQPYACLPSSDLP